jgi:hypothetical protein
LTASSSGSKKRISAVSGTCVPVVDGSDAADRSGDVIKNAVDDVRRNVEPSHAGRGRPPKIVQDPTIDAGFIWILATSLKLRTKLVEHVGVQPCLRLAETGDRPLPSRGEQVWAGLRADAIGARSRYFWQFVDDLEGKFGEMHLVRPVVLRPLPRDRPQTFVEIDFLPLRSTDFIASLRRQQEQSEHRAERPAERLAGTPEQLYFDIIKRPVASQFFSAPTHT